MMGSDILVWYGIMGKMINDNVDKIRGSLANEVRKRIPVYLPPVMIYDVDDNTDWVHPSNPAYITLGIRNIDGTLLDPTDPEKCNILTKMPNGESVMLWEDKVTKDHEGKVFDVTRNLRYKTYRDDLAKMCDGVTVSNEFLRDFYKEELGIENIFVLPNCVNIEDYPVNELKEHPEEIRILWQGGASHIPDLYPIKSAIETVINKYPNVKLVVWGGDYKYFFNGIPSDKIIFHQWVDYGYYREKRTIMNADINLCPLSDNIFARSKTAIKWYEASILDRPEATLAANVGPYKEIEDGKTGLLYNTIEEMVEKLSVLIENVELRKSLGANAKKRVIETRNIDNYAPGLYEFYSEIRRKQILKSGVN
jgi:glycosyltransferase involved in cell wall biosynthesis